MRCLKPVWQALEGGIGALTVASGMAAITYTIQTLCRAGDNIVSVSTLYGGTYNLFAMRCHVKVSKCVSLIIPKPETLVDLIDERTKLVFGESIGNPLGNAKYRKN